MTDHKITRVCPSACLSLSLSVIAPAVAIFNIIWWNFAQSFAAGKLRSSSLGVKSDYAFLYFTPDSSPNAISMGQSKHRSIDARWSIVVVNTSHEALLGSRCALSKNGITPNFPQICVQCIYNGNMLI